MSCLWFSSPVEFSKQFRSVTLSSSHDKDSIASDMTEMRLPGDGGVISSRNESELAVNVKPRPLIRRILM